MMRQPIPLLYFCNEVRRGGAEEHLLALLRGLDRTLFQPHLACMPEMAETLASDLPSDVRVFPVTLRRLSHLFGMRRLAQIIRETRAGIVHSHLFYASLFASPVARLCGVPLILETPHVREQWRSGLKSSYRVDRLLSRFCVHYHIAVSSANARYLRDEKGIPAGKIVVIHNGCNLQRFDPAYPAPADLRESLGFGPDDPVLVIVGRLEPQKGHTLLLTALPLIRRHVSSVRVVCVGEGSLRQPLLEQAEALGVADAVRFVGFQSDVRPWLALSTATVLPSFYEGLPLAAIESSASGKPVIASAVDGTPEVVQDGLTGRLFPSGNVESLAEAASSILLRPQAARRMGAAGRQRVLERFSLERQIERTQALYCEAWARRALQAHLYASAANNRKPAVNGEERI